MLAETSLQHRFHRAVCVEQTITRSEVRIPPRVVGVDGSRPSWYHGRWIEEILLIIEQRSRARDDSDPKAQRLEFASAHCRPYPSR